MSFHPNGVRPDTVRTIGELLDRAVHDALRRWRSLVIPFVLADALGSVVDDVTPDTWTAYVAVLLLSAVLENRARVVAVYAARGHTPRSSIGAALRNPVALAYVVLELFDSAPVYVAGAVVPAAGGAILLVARTSPLHGAAYIAGILLALALIVLAGAALLAVSMLIPLACTAAFLDTVADGTPPRRAVAYWFRQTFRVGSIVPSLVGAIAFTLLVSGTPELLDAVFDSGLPVVRHLLFAIPEGIGDAIAILFVLGWRDAVLDRRRGRDLDALLDAGQSSERVSPAASSPGATTSQ